MGGYSNIFLYNILQKSNNMFTDLDRDELLKDTRYSQQEYRKY